MNSQQNRQQKTQDDRYSNQNPPQDTSKNRSEQASRGEEHDNRRESVESGREGMEDEPTSGGSRGKFDYQQTNA